MLLEDCPAYPMVIFGKVRFSGSLERSALEPALRDALRLHPLLTAIAQKNVHGDWVWVACAENHEVIRWMDDKSELTPVMPFDIRVRPGFYLNARQTESGTETLFQFHHSCCDGRAAFAFMDDFLTAYLARLNLIPTGPVPLKQKLSSLGEARAVKDISKPPELFRAIRELWVRLKRAGKFLYTSPAPLVHNHSISPDSRLLQGFPASITRTLNTAETSGLKENAKGLGVTVNEIMACDLFLAIRDWKQRCGQTDGRDRLRIAVPVDIRTHTELRHMTGNRASLVFLDRQGEGLNDPDRLLSGIHAEMEQIKRLRLGQTFVGSLRLMRAFPGIREKIRGREKCRCTCVMTNLGRWPFRRSLPRREGRVVLGDVVLESIECMAPLRPYTNATFNILNYGGRISVTLHYDARVLSNHEAGELLSIFMDLLRRSLTL